MRRELYLELGPDLSRLAAVEDGLLCEYAQERAGERKQTGSIYKGRVQRVLSGMQAAFVDVGLEKNAFLPVHAGEVRVGDELLVQVEADPPGGTKGLRLTRRIALPGRLCVLSPGEAGVHVSRKLPEAERARLAESCRDACPEGCALVLRTQAAQADAREIEEEARLLAQRWREIERAYAMRGAPGLVWQEEGLFSRMLRDLLTPETVRVCVQGAAEELPAWVPEGVVQRVADGMPLFDLAGIEQKLERALERRVWLDCGGYLVIDCCEALTVIDVNSGKCTGRTDLEETALKVNLEAVREAARQLRLRDIGGIVVIDFIDMKDGAHNAALLEALREAAAADRAKVSIVDMTPLGLVELTRKRLASPLHEQLERPCPVCGGSGRVPSVEETARRALLQARRRAAGGSEAALLVRVHPSAQEALCALHAPAGCAVYALADARMRPGTFALTALCTGEALPAEAVPLPSLNRKE